MWHPVEDTSIDDSDEWDWEDDDGNISASLRITGNGLQITGRRADRGEVRERLGQTEPGVGDPTRLSGVSRFACVFASGVRLVGN